MSKKSENSSEPRTEQDGMIEYVETAGDCLCLTPSIYPLGAVMYQAIKSFFGYSQNEQLDFDKKKNEVGKCEGNSSNNGKKEHRPLAANKIKG